MTRGAPHCVICNQSTNKYNSSAAPSQAVTLQASNQEFASSHNGISARNVAPSLQAEREVVGENELEALRKDGGQRGSEGPRERGTRRTRGWASHQSCVWWLEIRDRIARGDCSLPKGYGHECVCVCVWGGVSSSGSLSGGCIPCLSCTLWPLPAPIEALHFIHCLLCCLL